MFYNNVQNSGNFGKLFSLFVESFHYFGNFANAK